MKKFNVFIHNNRVLDRKILVDTIEAPSKKEATNEAASKFQGRWCSVKEII